MVAYSGGERRHPAVTVLQIHVEQAVHLRVCHQLLHAASIAGKYAVSQQQASHGAGRHRVLQALVEGPREAVASVGGRVQHRMRRHPAAEGVRHGSRVAALQASSETRLVGADQRGQTVVAERRCRLRCRLTELLDRGRDFSRAREEKEENEKNRNKERELQRRGREEKLVENEKKRGLGDGGR